MWRGKGARIGDHWSDGMSVSQSLKLISDVEARKRVGKLK